MKTFCVSAMAVAIVFCAVVASGSLGRLLGESGREQVTCPTCNGTGKVKVNSETWDTCKTCNGTGKVEKRNTLADEKKQDEKKQTTYKATGTCSVDCPTGDGGTVCRIFTASCSGMLTREAAESTVKAQLNAQISNSGGTLKGGLNISVSAEAKW